MKGKRQKKIEVVLRTMIAVLALVGMLLECPSAQAAQDMVRAKSRLERRIQQQIKDEDPKKGILTCTATELHREYQANEIAADAKYKRKWVQVRGSVAHVAKDISGTPYIAFATNGVGQVQAALFDVQIKTMSASGFSACTVMEKAAGVRPGQKLTVECLGKGSAIGMPRLEQCVIVPNESN